MAEDWKAGGLCSCFDDCGVFCKVLVCPCMVYGEIKEALHGGEVPKEYSYKPCCCFCCMMAFAPFCIPCTLTGRTRSQIRSKYNLKPDCCGDCCTHTFCGCLAMMQERREFKSRPLQPWPPATEEEEQSSYEPPAPERIATL